MAEEKTIRLSQLARKLNVATTTIATYLSEKGFKIENKPNTKITLEQHILLNEAFAGAAMDKEEAAEVTIGKSYEKELSKVASLPQQQKVVEQPVIKPSVTKQEKQKQEKEKITLVPPTEPLIISKETLQKSSKTIHPPANAVKNQETPISERTIKKPKKSQPIEIEVPKGEQHAVNESLEAKQQDITASEKKITKEVIEDHVTIPFLEKTIPQPKVDEKEEKPVTPTNNRFIEQVNKGPEKIVLTNQEDFRGITVLGKIELAEKPSKKFQQVASSDLEKKSQKRPRKRLKVTQEPEKEKNKKPKKNHQVVNKPIKQPEKVNKQVVSEREIQEQIKHTLAKLSGNKSTSNRTKYRKEKRSSIAEVKAEQRLREAQSAKVLQLTEFISANDLASLMGITINELLSTCMNLGILVSINQRLDAEVITIIADEFGYQVEFNDVKAEAFEEDETEADVTDLVERAPIVTIMGHVDHGKTSLLDYIRNTQITQTEAGGITQHIGAYDVRTASGKHIAFLDTPGHEAFTAMRARGAKITDIAIIVVAGDDGVRPQTKEAINHAKLAGVPIIIAINKIDKPTVNIEKVKEELAQLNVLVEDWGGKYQCQGVSAKTGEGIEALLEKVLFEAELLGLKANPNKKARGTVVEASLDQGRGYLSTIMVQDGTLKVGEVILSGGYYGKVKAMFDYLGNNVKQAGPSMPIQILGLNGAPQAGDVFRVMASDKEARDIANQRQQILREQGLRTKTHITLDEIGRRLAIGSFKELNIIVKGDVDGSVEALSDSLLKLSNEEVKVNLLHKGVGAIVESDILLAVASDAVVIGFQVRPNTAVRKLAEKEGIEIRLYSIIYDAINDIKDAMEGMLAPKIEEHITGTALVKEIFKITGAGTIAGCYITEGYVKKTNPLRVIRDGIVIYTGTIKQIRHFKEELQQAKSGTECGISVNNFSDLKANDVIEGFEEREVERKL